MEFNNSELEWLAKQYNIASQFASSIALLCKTAEVTAEELPVSNVETDVLYGLCAAYMVVLDKILDDKYLAKSRSTKTIH